MAGLFGSQTMRLMREKWGSTQTLAEELFAMFSGTNPMTISAPVTIDPPKTTQGNTTINQTRAGDSNLTINTSVTNNGPVTNNGDVFNAGNTTINGPKTEIIDEDGLRKKLEDYIKDLISKSGGGGSGNGVLFGVILEGNGKQYNVDISMTGIPGAGSIQVNFPNLPESDKLSSGVYIDGIVLASDGKYYAQAPPQRAYFGKVIGGSGTSYSCTIYTIEGQEVGSQQVELSPGMDTGDPLDADTLLFPVIYSGGAWRAQPDLWQ